MSEPEFDGAKAGRGVVASATLAFVALIFTVALTFAAVEAPRLVNEYLEEHVSTPGFDSALGPANAALAEAFVEYHHLRLLGYTCLALVLLMIVVGFVSGRLGLASAGAFAFFLPVFGQFAATMFFLSGLGLLRVSWLPLLDTSYASLALTNVIELPYRLVIAGGDRLDLNLRPSLPWVVMGSGMLVFILGTLAWLQTRLGRRTTATTLVYRFSRHPQYLGWIVWSYGLIFHVGSIRRPRVSWQLSSALPWVVSMLVIIGIALAEELRMEREHGDEYREYARRTPFLMPLPRFLAVPLALPLHLAQPPGRPRTRVRIALAVAFYAAVLVVLSAIAPGVAALRRADVPVFAARDATIVRLEATAREAKERRPRFQAANDLAGLGVRGVAALSRLLGDQDPQVRGFAANALGLAGGAQAVALLAGALRDSSPEVRFSAVRALVKIGEPDVVPPLVTVLADEDRLVRHTAAVGVADLGWAGAVDALMPFMKAPEKWYRAPTAAALGRLRSARAIPELIAAIADEETEVREAAALALGEIGGVAVVEPLTRALRDASPSVRRCAIVALRRTREPAALAALRPQP
jgi:hypothetical protein